MTYSLTTSDPRYLRVRAEGQYGLAALEKLWTDVYRECAARRLNRLFIDLTGVDGDVPNMDRFAMGQLLARLHRETLIKLAAVDRPERINKFLENVAVNRGASVMVFPAEKEALEWLLG